MNSYRNMSARRLVPPLVLEQLVQHVHACFCLSQTAAPDYRSRSVRAPPDCDLVFIH